MSIQTTNSFSVRRSIERSKKITEIAISKDAFDSIFDSIIIQSFESLVESTIQSSFEEFMNQKKYITQNAFDFKNIEEKRVYDSSDSKNETFESENDIDVSSIIQSTIRQSTRQKIAYYFNVFVLKRKRFELIDEKKIVEYRNKISRAMTTLLSQKFINNDIDE